MEWHDTRQMQPLNFGKYLVLVDHPRSKKKGKFKLYIGEWSEAIFTRENMWDLSLVYGNLERKKEWSDRVIYWMEIPTPPKYFTD